MQARMKRSKIKERKKGKEGMVDQTRNYQIPIIPSRNSSRRDILQSSNLLQTLRRKRQTCF